MGNVHFVDVLRKDTGLDSTTELKALMDDRVLWRRSIDIRTIVRLFRVGAQHFQKPFIIF